MHTNVPNFTLKKIKINSISAFSEEQYEKLYRFMKTKKYLTDGLKNCKDRIVKRHRSQLMTFILLITNTE